MSLSAHGGVANRFKMLKSYRLSPLPVSPFAGYKIKIGFFPFFNWRNGINRQPANLQLYKIQVIS